jgi:MerR family mercuric resistance operon transcriptional regulator
MPAITNPRGEALTIGELSRRTGVKTETVRYFERIGMIAEPPRTEGGHRLYNADHVRTLKFIRRGRELGFSPNEVRALLGLGGPGKATCAGVREIAAHHLEDVRAKIADLSLLERLLATTIEQCTGEAVLDCPMMEVLDGASETGGPTPQSM